MRLSSLAICRGGRCESEYGMGFLDMRQWMAQLEQHGKRRRLTKLFASGLGARSRLALALGFPHDATNRDLVQYVMKKNRETIAPVLVDSGPVKEVIVRGEDIDQTEFPVPKWHYLEGGRYIHTFSSIVTKDPDTGVTNVGMYRGMIEHKDTAPFLLGKGGQHWGAHFVKWAARGKPMPVACVIGWDP